MIGQTSIDNEGDGDNIEAYYERLTVEMTKMMTIIMLTMI